LPNAAQKTPDLYLVLGCFGRVDDSFVSCSGCDNKILLIGPKLENYNGVVDYLDTCRLFDKPCFDLNAIKHIINHMQDQFDQIGIGRRLWNERQLQLYQKFISDHRLCGLYLKLEVKLVEEEPQIEEKTIKIASTTSQKKLITAPKLNLTLLRNRK
jgi:hypothetical protein